MSANAPNTLADRFAITLGEMRAAMAAEGPTKGLARALQEAILGLLECILALLLEFKAGRLAAAPAAAGPRTAEANDPETAEIAAKAPRPARIRWPSSHIPAASAAGVAEAAEAGAAEARAEDGFPTSPLRHAGPSLSPQRGEDEFGAFDRARDPGDRPRRARFQKIRG